MKKIILLSALLAAVATAGVYVTGPLALAEDKSKTAAPPPAAAAKPPQEVATLRLEPQSIEITHSLPGRIAAFRQSVVRPQVDGIITKRMFEEGSEVKKGQQLYQIDDTRYKAILNSAIADLHSAQANIKAVKARANRYANLVKVNAISRQDYDDAVAGLDQANASVIVAQAAIDLAKVDLNYTKVYAPISGRISRSIVTEGALVTANQTQELATITQLDPVYVDMQQSGVGQTVMDFAISSAEQPIAVHLELERRTGSVTYEHAGELKFSEVTVDQSTGAITLRAVVPNPDGKLLPGMFVRAKLALGEEEALLVPQRATTRTAQGELKVWVVDSEGNARQRSIQTEAAYQDNWIVSSGLQVGDELIVEGYQKVTDGQAVKTVSWNSDKHAATKLASLSGV